MKGLFVTAIRKNEGCMSVLLITKRIIAQILAAKKKDPNTETFALERQIDKVVYASTASRQRRLRLWRGKVDKEQ